MDVPAQPSVLLLGHVSEQQRSALLQNMVALVTPSPFESLSLALLESWMHGQPALVNGRHEVGKPGPGLRAPGVRLADRDGALETFLHERLSATTTAAAD